MLLVVSIVFSSLLMLYFGLLSVLFTTYLMALKAAIPSAVLPTLNLYLRTPLVEHVIYFVVSVFLPGDAEIDDGGEVTRGAKADDRR